MKNKIIGVGLLSAVFVISGCGGGELGGQIALEIKNARQPAEIELPDFSNDNSLMTMRALTKSGVDPLKVVTFKVTITGDDMPEGIVTEADAAADQIQVLGISPGIRDILIEAYNGNDEVIRRRLIEDVTIKAGVVTPVQTSLNTIPIILNYKNNAVVLSSYFRIYGFGEPESTLAIQSASESHDLNLCINAAGDEMTVSPDVNTGLFEHVPETHAIGKQDIILTDTTNNEFSKKKITLVDADNRPGFKFVAAGSVSPITTVGTGFGGAPDNNYPLVLNALGNQ